jgi:L-lactate dehydrogenase complex protein LldE
MRVGLFIPCYIEQFYPQVGLATVQVLERYGATVEYPHGQTCCGQPMANMGCTDAARPVAEHFVDLFEDHDYVVGPSGSCVSMVRNHYGGLIADRRRLEKIRKKTFELCEFLHDVLEIGHLEGRFPHQVGLHQGCHGLRELRLASSSELVVGHFNKVRSLLESLDGIRFSQLQRPDECCGFGGTFSVAEESVSCMMGQDRLHDHLQAGTEVLTSVDMSCLMHQEGLMRRAARLGGGSPGGGRAMRVMHVAEIMAESA